MRFIITRSTLLVIFGIILAIIVAFARGYRINFLERKIVPTGILAVSSSPDGAKITINGDLKGATNTNISLPPGKYGIKISKEGYSNWEDDVTIKGEVVSQISAILFPQNPSLSPLTSLGVIKAQFYPTVNKVIILSDNANNTATPSAETETIKSAGIYILEVAKKPLSVFNPLKLLVAKDDFPINFDLEDVDSQISPDGKEIILTITTSAKLVKNYLISTEDMSTPFDITTSKNTVLSAWELQKEKIDNKIFEALKNPLTNVAISSFEIISISPDETKLLYRATKNVTLPLVIKPRLIGTNQTTEERDIKSGKIYVYDKKEDKNYLLTDLDIKQSASVTTEEIENYLLWFPDSLRLVVKNSDHISIVDFDGTHKQTVYSGPFEQNFLAVSTDGKLIILANLNPQSNKLPDVYAVGIR